MIFSITGRWLEEISDRSSIVLMVFSYSILVKNMSKLEEWTFRLSVCVCGKI